MTDVTPQDARAFVSNFHPGGAEAVKGMPDADVLTYHKSVHGHYSKAVGDAVEAAKKELTPQTWPDAWRKLMAGEDEKQLKQIERYATPADVWTKARSLEQKLSSGEYRRTTPFPDKGTPEEQAAWRRDSGIPDAPEKYVVPQGKDGKPLADPTKPETTSFLKAAHAAHMPQAHVNAVLQFMNEEAARINAEDEQQDEKERTATEDKLRGEWGQDYRRNENLIENLLATAPPALRDVLNQTRLADGVLLKNSADMKRFLVQLALQVNPVSTVLPNSTGNIGQALEDEIGKLQKMMGDKRSAYWKGPEADKLQQRYRDLITAQERHKKAA